ncbi:MAG: hypothetical protein WC539_05485 [Nitrospirota bacterium]
MPTEIDEPIDVGVIFSCGKIKPIWFARSSRQIRIQKVTFHWKTRQGKEDLIHFSVTDGHNLYEIRFHTETMIWRLAHTE